MRDYNRDSIRGTNRTVKNRSRQTPWINKEADPDMTLQRRRRNRRLAKRKREAQIRRRKAVLLLIGIALILFILSGVRAAFRTSKEPLDETVNIALTTNLSSEVMDYENIVRQYAEENDIADYSNLLLAIMQVESGGKGSDVMQASESLSLPLNSLEPEASIQQGCKYFASLLKISREKGCDLDSVIQAYNYGPGYLNYVAENGGKHSLELAIEFANEKSGGSTVTYTNTVAVNYNGGWRYKYGNMFYVELVKAYIKE